MRRFAEIKSNGRVGRVTVAPSLKWCEQELGGTWVETFKDRSSRFNYAAKGFMYDEERDAFIPPKPYSSWVLNEDTCLWEAPIPMPDDGKDYVWVDVLGNWFAKETT